MDRRYQSYNETSQDQNKTKPMPKLAIWIDEQSHSDVTCQEPSNKYSIKFISDIEVILYILKFVDTPEEKTALSEMNKWNYSNRNVWVEI